MDPLELEALRLIRANRGHVGDEISVSSSEEDDEPRLGAFHLSRQLVLRLAAKRVQSKPHVSIEHEEGAGGFAEVRS